MEVHWDTMTVVLNGHEFACPECKERVVEMDAKTFKPCGHRIPDFR